MEARPPPSWSTPKCDFTNTLQCPFAIAGLRMPMSLRARMAAATLPDQIPVPLSPAPPNPGLPLAAQWLSGIERRGQVNKQPPLDSQP